jgi:hypothetical protein
MENSLQLDARLTAIEAANPREGTGGGSSDPWWRNTAAVTVITGLIAAVLPAMTLIDGCQQNSREAARLQIEQQDKIRQTYLERVLTPGVQEAQQVLVYSLLSRMKADPELSGWAEEQLTKAEVKLADSQKEKKELEAGIKLRDAELEAARREIAALETGAQPASPTAIAEQEQKIQELASVLMQEKRDVADISQRIGEPTRSARDKPTVYVHFRGSIQRTVAESLRSKLEAEFFAPGVERVDGIYESEVRFFHLEDRQLAERVADRAAGFLEARGCAPSKVATKSSRLAAPSNQVEIWIHTDCSS